jgi:muconolactone delta-isomerase
MGEAKVMGVMALDLKEVVKELDAEIKDKKVVDMKATVEENVGDEEAKYVISEGYRGKVARLHRRDGCYRGRSLTFNSYELVFGNPSPNSYTDYCRSCWSDSKPVWEVEDFVGIGSEDEGTTSTDE